MNYFYFGAALPGLTMDSKPSISQEEFRSLAAEHLCASDMEALDSLDSLYGNDDGHPFVSAWRSNEIALRNSLTKARAAALKTDPEKYMVDPSLFEGECDRVAGEALSRSNPVDKEQVLDRHRWSVLDELGGFDPFSSEAILAYSLKLAIAERWGAFDSDRGREVADTVLGTGEESTSANNGNSE